MAPIVSSKPASAVDKDDLSCQNSIESSRAAPHENLRVDKNHLAPYSNDHRVPSRDSRPSIANLAIRQYVESSRTNQAIKGQEWLLKREVPSTDEVLGVTFECENQDPPHNVIDRPWTSKEAYLKAQYGILREDMLRPIRLAIKKFREDPDMNDDNDTYVYQNIYIKGFVFADIGLAARISFSAARSGKKILWNQSRRLRQGTILAMTTAKDNFKSICKFVTVAGRATVGLQMNPPEIEILFADPSEIEIDPQQEWLLVEARMGYFEAYRHTLVALQRMVSERFPLEEHILGLERNVPTASQLDANPMMNMQSAFSQPSSSIDVVHQWPTVYQSQLDGSQVQALRRLLTKQLALIQGPPGTGKTRTSITGLRILVENMACNDPPIIIASQTNHALDQLLRHVSLFESNFIRLGSRTSDRETVKPRSLFVLRQNQRVKLDGGLKQEGRAQLTKATNFLKMLLRPFNQTAEPVSANILRELNLLTEDQLKSLSEEDDDWIRTSAEVQTPMASWLRGSISPMIYKRAENENNFATEESDPEFEQLREQEAENGGGFQRDDEEDSETLKGPYVALFEPFRARPSMGMSSSSIDHAFQQSDLWTVPEHLRPAMYARLMEHMKAKIRAMFRAEAEVYAKAVDVLKTGRWEENEVFLRKARIIGATTTGLSKYRGLIASLRPKIMIIEEAAETMEAMVVAGCVPSINHLILVGDHKQLQSQAVMPEFRKQPFNMNISLFERLVMNGVEYSVLTQQRRMRPEISRLLGPIYGAELQDHPSVHDRVHIRGMAQDCAFYDHSFSESADQSLSKINYREAEMIVGHYEHLFYNGVRADQITVLTFYNGQRKLLLRMLRARASLNGNIFNVATVDSFQGEENLVILLSLVRSNCKENIGFLAVPNRITVALSRAQYGFYIYGNISNLVSTNGMWWDVIASIPDDRLDEQPRPYLEAICKNHNAVVLVRNPEGWKDLKGGCRRKCEGVLPCGHPCRLTCHPFDHGQIQCEVPCSKRLACGHQCRYECGKECKCFCGELPVVAVVNARIPRSVQSQIGPRHTAISNHTPQQGSHTRALGPVMNGVQRLRWTETVPGELSLSPSSESWTKVSIPTTTSTVPRLNLVDLSVPADNAESKSFDAATLRQRLEELGHEAHENGFEQKTVTASELVKAEGLGRDFLEICEEEQGYGYGMIAKRWQDSVGSRAAFESLTQTESGSHVRAEEIEKPVSRIDFPAMRPQGLGIMPIEKSSTRRDRELRPVLGVDDDLIQF